MLVNFHDFWDFDRFFAKKVGKRCILTSCVDVRLKSQRTQTSSIKESSTFAWRLLTFKMPAPSSFSVLL